MKTIRFVKDYSILLADSFTKIYREGNVIDCRDDAKAQKMIDRGFAVEVI